ncbi:MAG: GNAT family N-acetyltransferase [Phycisphaerae bacterium]
MAIETEGKNLDPTIVMPGVRNAIQDPNRAIYFLAEIKGEIAGQTMITLEWSDWRNGFFWWIQSVYVPLKFRRRGVYRTLYEHIVVLAKDRDDVCGLRLYVHNSNKPAMETYRQLGMSETEYRLFEHAWR